MKSAEDPESTKSVAHTEEAMTNFLPSSPQKMTSIKRQINTATVRESYEAKSMQQRVCIELRNEHGAKT